MFEEDKTACAAVGGGEERCCCKWMGAAGVTKMKSSVKSPQGKKLPRGPMTALHLPAASPRREAGQECQVGPPRSR